MFLSRLSLRNPVLITMLTLALILFGFISMKTLGVDMFPNVDIPIVTVTTIYPGADASTIEEDVLKEIESGVGTLNGIKHMDGTALDNVGVMVITFEDGFDVDKAAQDVRDKVASVRSNMPDDIEDPVTEKIDLDALPVLSILLKAPAGENLSEVTDIAKRRVKDRLQTISGVGSVEMYGGREREIKILMDPLKIEQYGIPPITFLQLIGSSSIKIPAGTIYMNNSDEEITVQGDGEARTVDAYRNLPLMSMKGSTVKVKDIARVEDGLEEEESAAMMDLTPAVAMKLIKQSGVNVVQLAHSLKAEIAEINSTLPKGYSLTVVTDNTPFTEQAVSSSISDVFLGALLAMLIIFAFLMNKRAAFIIAVSLPTSIIGTFLFVKAMGFTLNFMTTLALSLSVGILTDDAIVVIEAIFRYIEKGRGKVEACIEATKEVGLAVITAELALIAVFGPTVYMEGTVGQFFREFGLTVVAAILISMTVSFTVTPLLSSKILKSEPKNFIFYRIMDKFLGMLERGYAAAVSWVLRHKVFTFMVAIGIFAGGIALVSHLKTTFVDDTDKGEFEIALELDGESSIQRSKEVSAEMVDKMKSYPWRQFFFTTIGGGNTKEKNIIRMRVSMVKKAERDLSQEDAMQIVRKDLGYMKKKYNAKISVAEVNEFGGNAAPVQLNIIGNDRDSIRSNARKVVAFMEQDGGFADIISSDKGSKKEVKVQFNHHKMSELGVNPAETAATLRYLISGKKVGDIDYKNGERYEVKAYIDRSFRNLDYLKNISLNSASGKTVKLSDVADISYNQNEIKITRRDRSKNITISSSLMQGADLGSQVKKVQEFAKVNFSDDVELQMAGDAERMKDSFTSLMQVLLIAVFLIYIVLASQFNSFIHPFTIMSSLPFAMTGAFLTLYLTDLSLGIMSFIGIIMLMGIVTKNSILLIDYALQQIHEGVEVTEALIASAKTRLRPILMTAGGTILGMVPIIISTAEGSEIKHPMGWAVFGGLLFSTLVTLFIVPVIFAVFDKFSRRSKVTV